MSTVIENDCLSQVSDALIPPGILSPGGGLIVYRTFQHDGCQTLGRPMLKAVNQTTREVMFFKPLCKTRSCPHCARILAKRWQFRAVYGCEVFQHQKRLDFVTVTSHERLDPAGSLAVLPVAWNKLRTRMARALPEKPEYFAVPEQHRNGRWHMHAIVTAKLPRRWWKDNARACGLGYQSDVQEVKTLGGVSAYVSKYINKTLQNSNLPKGSHVVRTSHGWPQLPEMPKPPGWGFYPVGHKTELAAEVERYQDIGFTVVLADGDSAWDWLENWSGGIAE